MLWPTCGPFPDSWQTLDIGFLNYDIIDLAHCSGEFSH